MPTQGPFYPGSELSAGGSGTAWLTGNAGSDNAIPDTIDMPQAEPVVDILALDNFGFTIPDGSIINGILIEANGTAFLNASPTVYIGPSKDGGLTYPGSSSNMGVDPSWVSYGSLSFLWGTTWTSAEINNNDFGVKVEPWAAALAFCSVEIDAIRVTVDYTVPGQTAYPDADLDASTWTATPLWSKVDEPTTPSDADYITGVAS